jgi:hypothetical protein
VPVLTEEQQTTRKGGRRWGRWIAFGMLAVVVGALVVPFAHPVRFSAGGTAVAIAGWKIPDVFVQEGGLPPEGFFAGENGGVRGVMFRVRNWMCVVSWGPAELALSD